MFESVEMLIFWVGSSLVRVRNYVLTLLVSRALFVGSCLLGIADFAAFHIYHLLLGCFQPFLPVLPPPVPVLSVHPLRVRFPGFVPTPSHGEHSFGRTPDPQRLAAGRAPVCL